MTPFAVTFQNSDINLLSQGRANADQKPAASGAAIGAGTGLLAGSLIGANNARAAAGSVQYDYDSVYARCMAARGNRIGGPPVAVVAPPPYPPPPPYWGPPGYYYRPYGYW